MNLSQLRFARALAETSSFTTAAAACFVTQPTLSNGIAELENELGQRLFERTTRKVTLTEFGKHMLQAISEVLRAQEALVMHAQAYLQPKHSLIRIGASPLISTNLLNAMVEPFRDQNPEVDLVLREMNLDDLYQLLDQRQLDFVLGVSDVRQSGGTRRYESAFLFREPLMFVPRRFDWQGNVRQGAVSFKDICQETFVMVPDTCGLTQATRSLFRKHRRDLHEYSGQAMSYQVLEQWARLGVGAAVLPGSKLTSESERAYAIADKSGETATIGFEAVWPSLQENDTCLAAFARHLKEVVPTLINGLLGSQVSIPAR